MRQRSGPHERGIALVSVLLGATLILLLLLTMLTMTETSGRVVARQLVSNGQAVNAASAGLNEGLSWFVRQPPPVTVFAPVRNLAATPPVNETDDAATGLERSYEISSPGRLWGRYTLRKAKILDISRQRGKQESGLIWSLESEGLVYVRNDSTREPDQRPNVIIGRSTMHAEIQRLGLAPPAPAAINALRGDNVNISAAGRVQGGTAIGVAFPANGPIKNSGEVTGTPAVQAGGPVAAAAFTVNRVFGVSQQELMTMADLVVNDGNDLPNPLPGMALIVVRGNAAFTPQRPLTGSGVLVVLGNLIVNPQSNSFYNGVIWVGGNLNISPPTVVNGTIVAQSNVTLSGGSEISEVNYDPAILNQVQLQKGSFAFSRTPWIAGRIGD